jgi:hypothetical protein
MSKFDGILSEAAYTISLDGFADSTGDVQEIGWYGRVDVSTVLLLNIGETELADRFAHEYGDQQYEVIIREDSQGFVTVISHAQNVSLDTEWSEIEDMCNPSDDAEGDTE